MKTEFDETLKQARPLYWVLTAAIAALYYWALQSAPSLREPLHFLSFTTLMLIHAALHWAGPIVKERRQWLIPYFVLQGCLIFTIVALAPAQGFIYGLYWAMAGEAAMILADLRAASLTIAAYMAVSAVNFGLQFGWHMIPALIAYIAPMTFFILVYSLMFQRQANARKQTHSLLLDLEAAHAKLAEYAVQVESLTLSNERERMARELHDTLAQGLAGLILQLEAVDTHILRNQNDRAQKITVQAMARARATLADARRAIDDLRQGDAEMDFASALREEAERFESATGIRCDCEIQIEREIPPIVREHSMRIVSEGLTNVARHAHAKNVNVRYVARNGSIMLEISDDGLGFDSSQPSASGHYGLIGMRERARLSGGTLEIHSKPNEGTTLKFSVALP